MKVFLSSTFRDLQVERDAVLRALQKYQLTAVAMELFLARPETPLETALEQLQQSDVVLLVIGFHAGSLLPDGSASSYTEAEFEQAAKDQKPILAFLQTGKKSKEWQNRERTKKKREALDRFKKAAETHTRVTFETPDQLVSAVILSLASWENRGRPGARKTFASPSEFFRSKVAHPSNPIFDFSQTLVGRRRSTDFLTEFLSSDSNSICLVSGRGGIGKSKLLRDWSAAVTDYEVVFLKEAPIWGADSHKEVPRGPVVVAVDDAHRPKGMDYLLQLFAELRAHQKIKLVLSTRPGGVAQIEQLLFRSFPPEAISYIALDELTADEAEALAAEALGDEFRMHARLLAEISNYTPWVIVAGARLILSRQINPLEMASFQDFRHEVGARFYAELNLEGPTFQINPPRRLLHIISAIGPVDARNEHFLRTVKGFLRCGKNDILTTLDQLAIHGIVTPRDEPVRIIPDVLSDYVLEDACVGPNKLDTGYVEKIFKGFREHFFRNLMQNLSELDWRLDRIGYGLERLDRVWKRIFSDFRAANILVRRKLLDDLTAAAAYQPSKILLLVKLARNTPSVEDHLSKELGAKRAYLIEALPRLLGAITYYPGHISESIDQLWELAVEEKEGNYHDRNAQHVLKQLASYQIYKVVALNFAMLLQCIRLCKRPDAFDRAFTPLDILDEILEREGEFTETRGYKVSFGGFGLPYDLVRLIRKNALEFLESLFYWNRCAPAVRAVESLGGLLHRFLNRVGRESSPEEVAWQDSERREVLSIFERRLGAAPVPLPIRGGIMRTLRLATGVTSTEEVREMARMLLNRINRDPDLLIFDAICTGDNNFPIVSTDPAVASWDEQSRAQLTEACAVLESNWLTPDARATELLSKLKLAYECKIEPRGFTRMLRFLSQDAALHSALVDCISSDLQAANLIQELSSALLALHGSSPGEFRLRARQLLESGIHYEIVAAAGALRIHADRATEEDVSLIEEFLRYPYASVKCSGLFAIAYLGQNRPLQPRLCRAVASVEIGGNPQVAASIADAFGPYGVSLALLTMEGVSRLLDQLLPLEDLDTNQGVILTLLSRLAAQFPGQILGFLIARIERALEGRAQGDYRYRAIRFTHGQVSFGSVERSTKKKLVSKCLNLYLQAAPPGELYRELFWSVVGGLDDDVLSPLVDAVNDHEPERLSRILLLIRASPGRLALSNRNFARAFLGKLSSESRREAVAAFVDNAQILASGFFGSTSDKPAGKRADGMEDAMDPLKNEGLEDLSRALQEASANAAKPSNEYGLEEEP